MRRSHTVVVSHRVEEAGSDPSDRVKSCPRGSKPTLAVEDLPLQGRLNWSNEDEFPAITIALGCSGYPESTFQQSGSLAGLVGISKVQFAEEYGDETDGRYNVLEDVLFTGVWRINGPRGRQQITSLEFDRFD